jgi:uncharacterized protein GlcG (DUF336 family)
VSIRTNTRDLVQPAQPGQPLAGLGNTPCGLSSGGLMVEVGGSLLGAVGVFGGPNEEEGENCVKAGLEAIRQKMEF